MPSGPRPRKTRLDELLVARGISPDVEQARRLIWAGAVIADDSLADQPAERYPEDVAIRLRGERGRFATRGGDKLDRALSDLGLDISGRWVLDVGAAGGGFTDCLLSRGARLVYAVDVGRGQLVPRLRADPRVVDLGGKDILSLTRRDLEPPPDFAVVDVTFRSLIEVLPKVRDLLAGEPEILALLKPMQEAGALSLERGADLQEAVFARLLPELRARELPICRVLLSRASGPGGALEFFLHLKAPGLTEAELQEEVARARTEGAAALRRRSVPGRSGAKRRRNWRRFRAR